MTPPEAPPRLAQVEQADGVICAPDPTGAVLRWPARLPLVIGAFTISVIVVLAFQRHEFTSPNWGLAVLVAVAVPWFLDMFGLPPMGKETRFRYPVLVAWSAVVIAGVWALGSWYYVTIDFAPFLLVMLIGEMTSTAGGRFGAVVLAICVAGMLYSTTVQHRSGNLIWVFGFAIGWMGGLAFRTQTRIATELVEAQEQLAEQAKEEERRHLAREIHDLIAHSLAVSMLHLSGARLALAAGDTDEATAALGDAEAAGRAAMAEIHRTVGLLGSATDGAAPPTPSAADLPELIDGFRRAGLDVRLRLDGSLGAVPLAPGLDGLPPRAGIVVQRGQARARAPRSICASRWTSTRWPSAPSTPSWRRSPAVLPAATGCAAWRSGWRCSAGRSRPAMAGARGR